MPANFSFFLDSSEELFCDCILYCIHNIKRTIKGVRIRAHFVAKCIDTAINFIPYLIYQWKNLYQH